MPSHISPAQHVWMVSVHALILSSSTLAYYPMCGCRVLSIPLKFQPWALLDYSVVSLLYEKKIRSIGHRSHLSLDTPSQPQLEHSQLHRMMDLENHLKTLEQEFRDG